MCGIAGWIDWKIDLTSYTKVIEKMGRTLSHRGPDANGFWFSPNSGLAHTRLVVIDPVGGAQPMIRDYGNRKYVITYNGELYNTAELKRELEELGHVFQSNSDTEVLLISYIEWGERSVNKLNGIYAFGVWDEAKQKLFLARDRLGVKPLFYHHSEDRLLFGSEIKAILAHPDVDAVVDEDGLSEIFGLGPSRTPGNGVFKGVKELRPGHFLVFDRKGLKINRYWQVESAPHLDDENTTIEKIRELLVDSIQRQLVSDVPICTFLSGGLDSSIISAVAGAQYQGSKRELNTYSIDYVDNYLHFNASEFQPNSDQKWINIMSEYIDSYHQNITLDIPPLVKTLKDAVLLRDLPGMADVDSSLLLFSREVKKNATVALSGECADEIFGGYPWFYRKEDLNSTAFPWVRSLNIRKNIISSELKTKLNLEGYIQDKYQQTIAEVPKLASDTNEQAKMRELFYINMTWFMSTLLERKDRMTMGTGLEVRVPFADHRIVEYAWNIPWEMKNMDGREKGLIRRAMKELLPIEIIERKKSPYPKTHHPKYTELVKEEINEILADGNEPLNQLIDRKYVTQLVESDVKDVNVPWFGQLMTGPQLLAYLLQINIWLKEYKVRIQ